MVDIYSFVPLLKDALNQYSPQRIIEWGTGKSTEIISGKKETIEIHTFEHNVKWFNHYKNRSSSNVKCYLLSLSEGYAQAGNKFLPSYFDFAFIDGRERVECMKTSKMLVKIGGVVMLHDSERERYKEGIKLFDKIKEENGTLIMLNR